MTGKPAPLMLIVAMQANLLALGGEMAIPYSISFDTERAVPTSDSEHANEAVGLPEGSEPFGL